MDVLTRDIMRCLGCWTTQSSSEFGVRPTYWAISKRLGVSAKTVKLRLESLEETGVIRRMRALPDASLFGLRKTGVLGVMDGVTSSKMRQKLPLFDFVETIYFVRPFQTQGEISRYKPYDASFLEMDMLHSDAEDLKRKVAIVREVFGNFVDVMRTDYPPYARLKPSKNELSVLVAFLADPLAEFEHIASRLGMSAKTVSKHLDELARANAFEIQPLYDYTKLDSMVFALGIPVEPRRRAAVVENLKEKLRENWLSENVGAESLIGITFTVENMSELDRLWVSITQDPEVAAAGLTLSPEYIDNQANASYLRAGQAPTRRA